MRQPAAGVRRVGQMKQHTLPHAQERSFGRGVGTMLVLIGAYQLVRGRTTLGVTLAVVGVVLVACGTLAPAALAVPSRLWWRLAHALGWFNSRVLLSLFYLFVMTPLGLAWRLLGRDPLTQRSSASTWVPYAVRRRDPKHYEHLF